MSDLDRLADDYNDMRRQRDERRVPGHGEPPASADAAEMT